MVLEIHPVLYVTSTINKGKRKYTDKELIDKEGWKDQRKEFIKKEKTKEKWKEQNKKKQNNKRKEDRKKEKIVYNFRILKTPADPKHEIDKSYTYGKLFFLWI